MVSSQIETHVSQLLKAPEVAQMMRVSIRSLWRMVANKEVPSPVRLGQRRYRWRQEDLIRFLGSL
jgi:predicted DNA-binding transcriptional regulator AlpA